MFYLRKQGFAVCRLYSLSTNIHIAPIPKAVPKTCLLPAPANFSTLYSADSQSEPLTNEKNKFLTDKEAFLKAKNDPDRFGDQSHTNDDDLLEWTVDDLAEEKFVGVHPTGKKLTTKQYAELIKEHLKHNRIKEAIDILEVKMLIEDRVKPETYIFNLLISGLARVGYSKKAFQLYNKMKQRGLKVTGGTYTALFNACAMTPWPQDGLNKIETLRQTMSEKGYEPNEINYNAMIKAYGRCGDVKSAFEIIDLLQSDPNLQLQIDSINMVLQACVSDKELGFRHALMVWHKMHQRKLMPDIYSFNSMLRCIRDCGLGDVDTIKQLINDIIKPNHINLLKPRNVPKQLNDGLNATSDLTNTRNESRHLSEVNPNDDDMDFSAPNLLSRTPHLGQLVDLKEVKQPSDRFLLVGGMTGFFYEMKVANVPPDVKVFTQLIEIIPSTMAAEKHLLSQLRVMNVKVDIDFFNILIKKRCLRFDYDAAQDVMGLIELAKLKPDIVTYGVLALTCVTEIEAENLIQEMHLNGIRMNMPILGAMLRQGCSKRNFPYILKILNIVKRLHMKPSEEFLTNLNVFQESCLNMVKFKNKSGNTHQFKLDFNIFKRELENWEIAMGLEKLSLEDAKKEVREHPWEQFKASQYRGMEEIKNPKSRLKPKTKKYIDKSQKKSNSSQEKE